MSIVTLLSDWGLADHYVAAVKGRLYCEWPDVRIVDISHHIPKYNDTVAAYVLKQAYPYFPPGTVHCICVNDIATPKRPHIVVYEGGQYFIGADNGIFPKLFDHKPAQAWRIMLKSDSETATFPSLNLFPMAAVHIAQGGDPAEIGEPYDWQGQNFNQKFNVAYIAEDYGENGLQVGARIIGKVIYTDSYGNGVTNIGRSMFEKVLAEFPHFDICLRPYDTHRGKQPFKLNRISRAYGEVPEADLCALFLDNQLLEISLNRASATQLINLKLQAPVTIHFKA